MFSQPEIVAHRRLARARMDVRDAWRGLRGGRETTLVAFLVLTLTMAAATVIFSVVDAVVFRPLPYASADRLVSLSLPTPVPGTLLPASASHYFAWLDGTQSFESLGAARFIAPLSFDVNGAVESLTARSVTANLFDVLGVHAAAGRLIGSRDERAKDAAVAVLSHDLWVRRFRADPTVIGRHLKFGGDTREVIGVLPEGVSFPITLGSPPDVYVPYIATPEERSTGRDLMFVVGRLRRGVTVQQARADVQRVSAAIAVPLHEQVVGAGKTPLLLVLAAVGFLLLVACVNVANLLLARATTRAPELAIREALGASRRRLGLGLLLEGLMLALAAAAAGVIVSLWGVEIAKANLPPGLTRVSSIAVDGRVLAVSIGVALLAALVFASAPTWLAAKGDLMGLMKTGGGAVMGNRGRDRALAAFLVADVAFVSVLLVATVLVVTTFIRITTIDLGFDRENVMSLGIRRSIEDVPESARPTVASAIRSDLLARVKAVPGVTDAALLLGGGPLSRSRARYGIIVPGVSKTQDDELNTSMVTPDYFRVMGMRLLRGRLFQSSDRGGAPLVMLINEVAARRFFPDRDPVGQTVTFRGSRTIVGVVQGVPINGPEEPIEPAMYMPLDQIPYKQSNMHGTVSGTLVVRTAQDPRGLAGAVHEAIRPALGGDPTQTVVVEDDFRRLTASRRFNAVLMTTFGLIAMVIGAIGIYGTMSFVVAQKVRAIGLRMALGAAPSRILRSVLNEALRRVGLGIGLGLACSWAVSSVFTSFVFGIRPTDPRVYVGVGGLLALVGLAAALVPALRAARLDPLTALRHD